MKKMWFNLKKTKDSITWNGDAIWGIVFIIIALLAAGGWVANIAKIFLGDASGAEIFARAVFAIAWPIGCIAGYF